MASVLLMDALLRQCQRLYGLDQEDEHEAPQLPTSYPEKIASGVEGRPVLPLSSDAPPTQSECAM